MVAVLEQVEHSLQVLQDRIESSIQSARGRIFSFGGLMIYVMGNVDYPCMKFELAVLNLVADGKIRLDKIHGDNHYVIL